MTRPWDYWLVGFAFCRLRSTVMETRKLVRQGEPLSIPKSPLQRLGIQGEMLLAVDTTDDRANLLRQVGGYPLETYSDERLTEFEESDRITTGGRRKVAKRRR